MISKAKWQRYIKKLADIDEHAGDLMRQYIEANGLQDNNALIDYAFGLATKYGEASAELGCEMVELMAAAQGVEIPPAVPAETATVQEVAKGVMYGKYHSPSQIPNIVSRKVRQAGADTVMKNAIVNNAEWAWVPSGDTCAFCITLASRGWQRASKKVLKGNHVEHIHSNCDCTFALAFNEKGKRKYDSVYDPKKYEDMYYGAEGHTPGDRINAMRRAKYHQNKDYINTQKRNAYQLRKLEDWALGEEGHKGLDRSTEWQRKRIYSDTYPRRMSAIGEPRKIREKVVEEARSILKHRNGTRFEDLVFIDSNTGEIKRQLNYDVKDKVEPTNEMKKMVEKNRHSIIAIHNHPLSVAPSEGDIISAYSHEYKYGIVVCHNGDIYKYTLKESVNISAYVSAYTRFDKASQSRDALPKFIEECKMSGVEIEFL